MKIAILIPGLIRTYKKTYENLFKYLIDPNVNSNKIDIYLAFWDKTHNRGINENVDVKIIEKNEIESLVNIYNPKKYIVLNDYEEKNNVFKEKGLKMKNLIGNPFHPDPKLLYQNGVFAQSYTWLKAFELIEESYDLIFKSRFDVIFLEKIFFQFLDLEKLNCFNKLSQHHPIGDICLAANELIMKKILLQYHTDLMNFKFPPISPTSRLWPEDILCDYVYFNKININLIKHKTDLIKR